MTRYVLLAALVASTVAQQQDPGVISDPGTYGPQVEIAHLYYDQWPTGKLSIVSPALCSRLQVLQFRDPVACSPTILLRSIL